MNKTLSFVRRSLRLKKIHFKEASFNNTDHLLISKDCENIVDFIPNKSIDLIITDPPYNIGIDYGAGFNDKRKWPEYYEWLKNKLVGIRDILSDKGSIYLISYPEINARLLPYLENELKFKFRRWITWHYPTNIGHSKKNFTRSQRSILFFTKSNKYIFHREDLIQHYKNPTVAVIKKRLARGSKGRTSYDLLRFLDLIELQKGLIDVLDINLVKNNSRDRVRNFKDKFKSLSKKELERKDHPCQLPLGLLETLVKVSSDKNSIVLDPFAGTFTTSAAAAKNGRSSIGIELNPKFIKFGLARLKGIQLP